MAVQFRYERLRRREGGILMASNERILGFYRAHPRTAVPELAIREPTDAHASGKSFISELGGQKWAGEP